MRVSDFLTEAGKSAIKDAVQRAERRTSGEIKVLVVGSSKRRWSVVSPQKAAHRRALREFAAMGVHKTADRTGVLVMLSLKERRVEVVADKAINEKVSQKTWERAVEIVVNHVQKGEPKAGIIRAVEFIGEVLAEHFPRKSDDRDELSDEVEIKE